MNEVAFGVLPELKGISISSVASSSGSSFAESTIAAFKRLEAFVVTTVTFRRADGSEKVGAYLQKLYTKTVAAFLPIGFTKFNEQIRALVEEWCPEELTVSSLTIHAPQDSASCPVQRKSYSASAYFISQRPSRYQIFPVIFGICYPLHGQYY